ncbi:reverse transcriptase domain-containing protein [Tanacetum coccineum]
MFTGPTVDIIVLQLPQRRFTIPDFIGLVSLRMIMSAYEKSLMYGDWILWDHFPNLEGDYAFSREVSGVTILRLSEKLNDALWAFRMAYKAPTWCTPFRLVYGKACHLPVKIEHKPHSALKHILLKNGLRIAMDSKLHGDKILWSLDIGLKKYLWLVNIVKETDEVIELQEWDINQSLLSAQTIRTYSFKITADLTQGFQYVVSWGMVQRINLCTVLAYAIYKDFDRNSRPLPDFEEYAIDTPYMILWSKIKKNTFSANTPYPKTPILRIGQYSVSKKSDMAYWSIRRIQKSDMAYPIPAQEFWNILFLEPTPSNPDTPY